VGSEPGSSRFHLFFNHFTAEPQRLPMQRISLLLLLFYPRMLSIIVRKIFFFSWGITIIHFSRIKSCLKTKRGKYFYVCVHPRRWSFISNYLVSGAAAVAVLGQVGEPGGEVLRRQPRQGGPVLPRLQHLLRGRLWYGGQCYEFVNNFTQKVTYLYD
jgi:hypothetical protein